MKEHRVSDAARYRRASLLLVAFAVAVTLGTATAAQTASAAGGTLKLTERLAEPRVVGGAEVPDGKYPFMASLQFDYPETSPKGDHFCGGTLIDQTHVLTAAHCAVYMRDGLPLEQVRVVVGTTVLDSEQGQARKIVNPSDISVHPGYDPRTNANDAAVLRLDTPVTGIRPIKLATAAQDFLETPGRLATVAGWGNTLTQPADGGGGQSFPDRMHEARPPLVSDPGCRKAYGKYFFPKLMVCAGEAGVDACQGDSGGPLFAPVDGEFVQIGVTSFGHGCAAPGYPGGYAEVNAPTISGFIQQTSRE